MLNPISATATVDAYQPTAASNRGVAERATNDHYHQQDHVELSPAAQGILKLGTAASVPGTPLPDPWENR